jgi:hypothetical protein
MAVVSFSEAAKVLGMKSRSTLYRLRDSELARYVRPPAHPGGAMRLELAPDGLPSLRDWLDAILQAQAKTPAEIPALAFGAAPSPAPAPAPADPANVAQGLAALVAGLPEDQIPNLATSRERRAHYLAEVSRLDALTQRGELVAKTEVMAAAFAAVRQTRDMLLGIPSRVAPQLVGVADTQTAYELLDKEIRYSLTALATAFEVDENS